MREKEKMKKKETRAKSDYQKNREKSKQ